MGMRDTTLVIMAAGIGSRFGGGIKQLQNDRAVGGLEQSGWRNHYGLFYP